MENSTPNPTSPPRRRLALGLRGAVAGAFLLGGVVGGAAGAVGTRAIEPGAVLAQAANPFAAPVVNATLPVSGDTVADVYARVSPGVVHIAAVQSGGRGGIGSGFVIDTQGHIVTNNHVVDGAQNVTVQFTDGTEAQAKVLGRDPAGDLALLQVDVSADKLTPLTLGDSNAARPGQLAIAIGNPLGLDNSVTAGVVSGTSRTEAAEGGRPLRGLIQTDAPINPGNSGGPLLNGQGEVIGVNTLGSVDAQGIGFAIPIDTVKTLLPRLQAGEVIQHAYLGIGGRDVTPNLAKTEGLPVDQGVLVVTVEPGGPAAGAGLKGAQNRQSGTGGDIIVAVDDQSVAKMDDLAAALDKHAPGDQVNIKVRRGGSETTLQVRLGTWPDQSSTPARTPRTPRGPRTPGMPEIPGIPGLP